MLRFPRSCVTAAMFAGVLILVSCEDGGPVAPEEPTMAIVAGSYGATGDYGALSLTTVDEGEQHDWLAYGAEFTLDLSADGTVSGNLYMPVPDGLEHYFEEEDQAGFQRDMAGTWTLTDGIVRFEQEGDSFVRDMEFVYSDGVLRAEETFDDVRVEVELMRR